MKEVLWSFLSRAAVAALVVWSGTPALAQTETEPNNSIAQANGPYASGVQISGSFSAAGDVDYFRLVLAQTSNVTILMNNGTPGQCPNNGQTDPTLTLYSSGGNQIAFNDDGPIGVCPLLAPSNVPAMANLAPGTYYIKAALLFSNVFPANYMLQVTATTTLTETFTYQGRLDSGGSPFTGSKQMTFSLWTDANSQELGSRMSLPLQFQAIEINKGLFTADLEFTVPGQPSTFDGTERFLQIEVADVGGANPVVLSPRTRLTSAPYSIYALSSKKSETAVYATTADSANTAGACNTANYAGFADNSDWSGLFGMPAGFADGVDNTGGWNEAFGVTSTLNQVAVNTTNAMTYDLAVNGTAAKTGGGAWASYSDARLKHDIKPMSGTLDRLLRLRGYSFEYNQDAVDTKLALPGTQLGLLAQEVEQVFPDWVGKDKDGYRYVTERATTALMVEALRDLRAEKTREIEEVRKIKDAEIAELKARLDRLEKAIGQSR